MEKLFYTIGEAADLLDESVSTVRYWSDFFSEYVKPGRNAKGNRLYTKEDIEILKQIRFLIRCEGYTLDGVKSVLAEDKSFVESRVKAIDLLKSIRAQLIEVRSSMIDGGKS